MRRARVGTNGGNGKGLHGQAPALQVICLGASGGPCEDNVTSFLVRSTGSNWARGSVLAVDAGSHLGPITRILERDSPLKEHKNGKAGQKADASWTQAVRGRESSVEEEDDTPELPEPTHITTGPFAGLTLPNESARANALFLLRTYISTYLITHPHLDHISGFAINTAAFHATSRPKTMAALPSTVDALKDHIFNDIIWPNLTDEDGGVGFVTFQRLKEGGDAMVGEGEGRGYIDVCDGLGVRAFKVSHGTCTRSPSNSTHRGSTAAAMAESQQLLAYSGMGQPASTALPPQPPSLPSEPSPHTTQRSYSIPHNHLSNPPTPNTHPTTTTRTRFPSLPHLHHIPSFPPIAAPSPPATHLAPAHACVVDSTAFFIRDEFSAREVLIFGDVEPDSLSLAPRNATVWAEAARKVARGLLGGILVESSYDDSQPDAFLFGHLNPRHLVVELGVLAGLVGVAREGLREEGEVEGRKRKRSAGLEGRRKRNGSGVEVEESGEGGGDEVESEGLLPLHGVKVVIIHVKDTFKDGPHVSERILEQLEEHEARLREEGRGLGCEFVVSQSGESYWF